MRTQLEQLLNKKVSGAGTITEIGSRDVLLKKIFIYPDIEVEHCWISKSKMIDIYNGEEIVFVARIYQYKKNVKEGIEIDYGLKILYWRPKPIKEIE